MTVSHDSFYKGASWNIQSTRVNKQPQSFLEARLRNIQKEIDKKFDELNKKIDNFDATLEADTREEDLRYRSND